MSWLLLFYVHRFFCACSFIQVPRFQSRLQPHCCKVPQTPGICPRQTHHCGSCDAAVLQPIAQDRLIWAALFRWSWLFLEYEASISFSDSDNGFLKVAVRNPHPHTNGTFMAWFFSILDCLCSIHRVMKSKSETLACRLSTCHPRIEPTQRMNWKMSPSLKSRLNQSPGCIKPRTNEENISCNVLQCNHANVSSCLVGFLTYMFWVYRNYDSRVLREHAK